MRKPFYTSLKTVPVSHVFRRMRSHPVYHLACTQLPRKWWHAMAKEHGQERAWVYGQAQPRVWYSYIPPDVQRAMYFVPEICPYEAERHIDLALFPHVCQSCGDATKDHVRSVFFKMPDDVPIGRLCRYCESDIRRAGSWAAWRRIQAAHQYDQEAAKLQQAVWLLSGTLRDARKALKAANAAA